MEPDRARLHSQPARDGRQFQVLHGKHRHLELARRKPETTGHFRPLFWGEDSLARVGRFNGRTVRTATTCAPSSAGLLCAQLPIGVVYRSLDSLLWAEK